MWTHKNFKIEVNESGKFVATSDEDHFEGPDA